MVAACDALSRQRLVDVAEERLARVGEDADLHLHAEIAVRVVEAIDGDGGSVSIRLSNTDQNSVKVEVIDTGRGISPDDISKVFEPYFSTKETGTGLGLAIVKKAVDDHGGTISVASKEGSGTTFTIILPAREKGHGTQEHTGS